MTPPSLPDPTQTVLVTAELDGIEMGVLGDGTPFLTGRGLARVCGLVPSCIVEQAQGWLEGQRHGRLHGFLVERGVDVVSLFVIGRRRNRGVHAYPDRIAMLIVEYYAFEAGNPIARQSYRVLARGGLRAFVYARTGYDAMPPLPEAWRQFHDRLLSNVVPAGYFSVFREMADLVLALVRAGLVVDEHCVPDVSVGRAWSAHWQTELAERYPERIRYDHNYPASFRQASTNPQPAWAYPDAALAAFRRWMAERYVPERLPAYLARQVGRGALAVETSASETGE